jgi:hypothetical protein
MAPQNLQFEQTVPRLTIKLLILPHAMQQCSPLYTTYSLPGLPQSHITRAFLTKILYTSLLFLSYVSRYCNVKALTVQPYVMQSAQKLEAENLDRIASEAPCRRTCPTPVVPPAVWYRGSGVYNVSSVLTLSMQRTPTLINMYLQTT